MNIDNLIKLEIERMPRSSKGYYKDINTGKIYSNDIFVPWREVKGNELDYIKNIINDKPINYKKDIINDKPITIKKILTILTLSCLSSLILYKIIKI